MTHTKCSIPSCWNGGEATTSSMSLPLKWKISFIDGRTGRQYEPKVHIPTGKERPFCVDFYTYSA